MFKATLFGALALVTASFAFAPAPASAQSLSIGIGGGGPRVVVRDRDYRPRTTVRRAVRTSPYGERTVVTTRSRSPRFVRTYPTRRIVTTTGSIGCREVTRRVVQGNRTVITKRRVC